jgi:hypothetical protein
MSGAAGSALISAGDTGRIRFVLQANARSTMSACWIWCRWLLYTRYFLPSGVDSRSPSAGVASPIGTNVRPSRTAPPTSRVDCGFAAPDPPVPDASGVWEHSVHGGLTRFFASGSESGAPWMPMGAPRGALFSADRDIITTSGAAPSAISTADA